MVTKKGKAKRLRLQKLNDVLGRLKEWERVAECANVAGGVVCCGRSVVCRMM